MGSPSNIVDSYIYSMEENELFAKGLQLQRPWFISSLRLEEGETDKGILHIHIEHEQHSKFIYEENEYTVYDHQERIWQHLNFFEHKCYLYARVPRVKTKEGKVRLVSVPWAHKGSSFTIKFEQDILDLISKGMTAVAAGRRYEIGGKRVFRIVKKYVTVALTSQLLDNVTNLSVDETSYKKGHNYLTITTDNDRKKVVGAAQGKDKEAFAHSLIDMELRGAYRDKVRIITMDMSRSYISGAQEAMPQAAIVFDRFHIVKKLNEAVDQIRREDQQKFKELKNSRYLWLTNNDKLKKKDRKRLDTLKDSYENIGKAYQLKEQFREVLNEAYNSSKLKPLNDWIKIAWKSELEPIRKFVNMLHNHWYGIKTYFKKLATNAFAERVNLKIQEIKRLARGYGNTYNFIIMIYFHLGGLDLKSTVFD